MTSKIAIIHNETGIHARPASEIVVVAKKYQSKIMLINGDKQANATSVIKLLTLGAKSGTEITVTAEGEDEAAAVEEMATFIESIRD